MMGLVQYSRFGRLRLRHFDASATDDRDRGGSACFEFLDNYWWDETVRGAQFLYHESDRERLGGVCLHFHYLASQLVDPILQAIHFPLRPGMTVEDAEGIFGRALASSDGAPGITMRDFLCPSEGRYWIRCYFTDGYGLHGTDIIRGDLLPETSRIAEPCATPNGGPATSVDNPNALGGPPSVS